MSISPRPWPGSTTIAALCVVAACAVGAQGRAADSSTTYEQTHSLRPAEGNDVAGTLLLLSDGDLLGTSARGGRFKSGTVFKVHPSTGKITVLHEFDPAIGEPRDPFAGLVRGPDGNFWGTCSGGGGGSGFGGTIYRVTAQGDLQTIHAFGHEPLDGQGPDAPLIVGSDGHLYGTTQFGGLLGEGTVYRLDEDGSTTILWHLGAKGEPAQPQARVIQAADGRLYGVSFFGGQQGQGSIFSLAPDGSDHQVLHSFDMAQGALPLGSLLDASDGNFYGTTLLGGAHALGTVYRMAHDGRFTVVHDFGDPPAGSRPGAGLIEASPGIFLGTTSAGGAFNEGTVFRMTADGSVESLHDFADRRHGDGAAPAAELTAMPDGTFYGSTQSGGDKKAGTLYRIDLR